MFLMITVADKPYMSHALELARRGAGFVSPNPMVGCVVVKNGKVIGEGWHRKFGGQHAEVEAFKRLQATGYRLQVTGATVYVTLEPCSHFGKTPPCADALIAAGVKRVVVGMKDPNPQVAGRGMRKLRAAGVRVDVGVLEKECRELNEDFCKWITARRPFVVLKTALTLDGALTLKKGTRSDFSSPESYKLVHDLRQRYDAIGLGVESVIIDNPLLTTRRKQRSRNPVRVIFDTNGRLPKHVRLLKQPGRTIIFHSSIDRVGVIGKVEYVKVPLASDGHVSLPHALAWLGEHGIMSIMIEGGAALAQSFLRQKLVDKLMIAFTPHLSPDPKAPRLFAAKFLRLPLQNIRWEQCGPDGWLIAQT